MKVVIITTLQAMFIYKGCKNKSKQSLLKKVVKITKLQAIFTDNFEQSLLMTLLMKVFKITTLQSIFTHDVCKMLLYTFENNTMMRYVHVIVHVDILAYGI